MQFTSVLVVARVIHSIGMGSLYGSSSLHCIAGHELHTGAKLFSGPKLSQLKESYGSKCVILPS